MGLQTEKQFFHIKGTDRKKCFPPELKSQTACFRAYIAAVIERGND